MEKEHELREIWVALGMIRYLYERDMFPSKSSLIDALEGVREELRGVLGWEVHESPPPLAIHPKPLELLDDTPQ